MKTNKTKNKRTKKEIAQEVYKITPYARVEGDESNAQIILDVIEEVISDEEIEELDELGLRFANETKDWLFCRTNNSPSNGYDPHTAGYVKCTEIQVAEYIALREIADAVKGGDQKKIKKALRIYEKTLHEPWKPLFDEVEFDD